jgi:hypothetical protein
MSQFLMLFSRKTTRRKALVSISSFDSGKAPTKRPHAAKRWRDLAYQKRIQHLKKIILLAPRKQASNATARGWVVNMLRGNGPGPDDNIF